MCVFVLLLASAGGTPRGFRLILLTSPSWAESATVSTEFCWRVRGKDPTRSQSQSLKHVAVW